MLDVDLRISIVLIAPSILKTQERLEDLLTSVRKVRFIWKKVKLNLS